jgi:peptidoglycan/xylan/chitin deacetylase (PgdA/CDA1 family)
MGRLRTAFKPAIENAILNSGIAAVSHRLQRSKTLVLAFHNIVPSGVPAAGETSLHLAQAAFARQLDTLCRMGDVVPLSSILAPPTSSRCRFALTFDDAYAGALTAGIAELRERSLPATIFVAPGLLDQTTWWDEVANPDTGEVPGTTRDHALEALAGRQEAVRAMMQPSTVAALLPIPRIGSLAQLRHATKYDGVALGSHTWSHLNLAALEADELQRELQLPHDWLTANFPDSYIPWLSYPYGRSSTEVESAAARAGYRAALRVDGGWMGADHRRRSYALPRWNVPRGVSEGGFRLRLSGIGA